MVIFHSFLYVYQRVCSSSVDPGGQPWLRLRFVQALGFAAPADGNSVSEEKECIGMGAVHDVHLQMMHTYNM